MNYNELLEKYHLVLIENDILKQEIQALKAKLGAQQTQEPYGDNLHQKADEPANQKVAETVLY